jgi:hypothetical protein
MASVVNIPCAGSRNTGARRLDDWFWYLDGSAQGAVNDVVPSGHIQDGWMREALEQQLLRLWCEEEMEQRQMLEEFEDCQR